MNTNISREDFLKLRDTLINVNSWIHGKFAVKLETTCVRCINFDEKVEICRLAKVRPPAKVIAYGCPEFFDKDEIPY